MISFILVLLLSLVSVFAYAEESKVEWVNKFGRESQVERKRCNFDSDCRVITDRMHNITAVVEGDVERYRRRKNDPVVCLGCSEGSESDYVPKCVANSCRAVRKNTDSEIWVECRKDSDCMVWRDACGKVVASPVKPRKRHTELIGVYGVPRCLKGRSNEDVVDYYPTCEDFKCTPKAKKLNTKGKKEAK
ncbi:hypothetical protein [Bdellovibrio sp. HCB209]|uniref:hypothetical protein n=1 Tax=Bdellovibrio sp. HCB209 TaxID=3394354 RepID=UPI0039B4EA2B